MTHVTTYHPDLEQLVDLFVAQTNNPSKHFFRLQIAFFLGAVASNMRAAIHGWSNNSVPINIYAINLSPSGAGKGFSTRSLNKDMLGVFYEVFLENTMPISSAANLAKIASKRAIIKGTDQTEELVKLEKEYNLLGAFFPTFDSASVPAVKQLRHKIQLADCGGLNLMMDEIGVNLLGQADSLNVFLELYDMGDAQDKLIKSNAENLRTERLTTPTPTNMLLFGEPTALFDSAATEAKFMKMLGTGYARRCFYGYVTNFNKNLERTPEEMLASMNSTASNKIIETLSDRFGVLADATNLNAKVRIEEAEALKLMTYKIHCERLASKMPEHEQTRKAEMEHRYFKVLKLAGAYAFFDNSPTITDTHLDYAITLAEDSGEHFRTMITPIKPYVRLAQYLAQAYPNEMTMADLDRDLPYMPSAKAAKEEMITMATAWGYKNNHVIRRTTSNGIIFYSGETLEQTDLSKMILSYSQDETINYINKHISFDKLDGLFKLPQLRHWLNHHLEAGHRHDAGIKKGFNLLVFDVDGECPVSVAQTVLAKYSYKIYTTKRHGQDGKDRYRIVLPINYVLYMDNGEYKQLLKSICQELPLIRLDESANHRVKKWLTNPACKMLTNKGELFDVLPFIPNTSKAEERERTYANQTDLSALERWILNTAEEGQRNNTLFRYAMILVDLGHSFAEVCAALKELNTKLQSPLDEAELTMTVIQSVSNKYTHSPK